ncbi:MAG TPA: hypothetical protein PKD90_06315 [Phnomibacter sp.]|nr:hypothetical protein [Phnomibacter sp.]
MDIQPALLPHTQIDKKRWDAAVNGAANGLVYARSLWLDAMSPGWDALATDDYDFVMPLTWRSKMGIKYMCPPAFTQQLGIFSSQPVTPPVAEAFLRKVAMQYRLAEVFLNHSTPSVPSAKAHQNYLLPLQAGYPAIQANYKKDLLKNLQRTQKFNLVYSPTDNVAQAIEEYRTAYHTRIGFRPQDYVAFTQLALKLHATNELIARQVCLPNGTLLAIGIFVKDRRRLYNLASTTLPNGRTLEANHFLFDQLIQEFAGMPLTLDFEGSDQPGIARFFQKFGAQPETYWYWKSNRLPAVMRWWKR